MTAPLAVVNGTYNKRFLLISAVPNTIITLPQQNANDPSARLIEWLVADGARVEAGTPIVVLETSKATFDIDAPRAGYIFQLCDTDQMVAVGGELAIVSDTATRPEDAAKALSKTTEQEEQRSDHHEKSPSTDGATSLGGE